MLNLSAVILTYNEELHIKRCLDNITPLVKEVFLIDSYSTDRTLEIAGQYDNVTILQNSWTTHAKQFNWGLRNAPITTDWIIRLDADEYLLPELQNELIEKLPNIDKRVSGIVLKRRLIFLGKWIRRGTYPIKLLRIFRRNKGLSEERFMDEHICLLEGSSVEMEHDFVDHNLNNLSIWSQKHIGYAIREAVDLLDMEYNITGVAANDRNVCITDQAKSKRMKKHRYALAPLFLRSFAYFCYRYIIQLGFTEGKEGFLWHFLQGWWYRTLVDVKLFEIKSKCGNDKNRIINYLADEYGITL